MSASQFASFAAYTPPPDEFDHPSTPSVSKPPGSAWFQTPPVESSYQSGGIPTFNSSRSGGPSAVSDEDPPTNQWETTYGWRVDILALCAYLLGPVSALALLILETQNDYVRFHAYQSALLTTPLVLIRMLLSIAHFPSWIKTLCTLTIIAIQLFVGFFAYRDASQNGLVHFHAPFVGAIAEKWLADE
ncbi:hypothetical protein BDZ97DRAFT_1751875 [Flammula alnicola]|nr:hypothetical protein BDZ97DRAFT_1751875 [Flammula alnicola]